MNIDVKIAFTTIKPICDVLMICPTLETLEAYTVLVNNMKKEAIQELQQYLLFPLISRLKCKEMSGKEEVLLKMIAAVKLVVEKIMINSFEMFLKIETGLVSIIFNCKTQKLIPNISEEIKLAIMECLTVTMLHIPYELKEKVLDKQVPTLGQSVYVSVKIAKQEQMRALRLAALESLVAHTLTHPQMTKDYHIPQPALEQLAVEKLLAGTLPGVLGALQDVAVARDNQGHKVTVAAIDAIHRVLCIGMNDKYLPAPPELRTEDFIKMVRERKKAMPEVSKKAKSKSIKEVAIRSAAWYELADSRLVAVTSSLCGLRTHEHPRVRRELAVFCYRLLTECSLTMKISQAMCLDVLIAYSKDEYSEVSEYASEALDSYLASTLDNKLRVADSLAENFLSVLTTMPRVLNAIENSHKLSALNLMHGYICVLADGGRPQRLTSILSVAANMLQLTAALCHAARHAPRLAALTRHAARDVSAPPPRSSPWSTFLLLDSPEAVERLQQVCQLLGACECSELILDSLLDQFRTKAEPEIVFICNWMCSAPKAPESIARRLLTTYLEEDIWYLPLEVDSGEAPLTQEETLDPTVYNPRAWTKDSVPDLYEGTVETRYTDISYARPRLAPSASRGAGSLGEAHANLVLSCLLTAGLAHAAERLAEAFQPYLLRTLCPALERVGSEYELLHLAGLKAINAIAAACGHESVGELIKANADYFTNKITVSLRKSWNCQSALQILTVVMEYSDASILDCMYGIVEHVLVQSCDKYYEKNLSAYLQVFLTFVDCLRSWFPGDCGAEADTQEEEIDLLAELNEYVRETQEAERLLSDSDIDSGKSLEEMYKEDMNKKEEDALDYDDTVAAEKPPLPQHVSMSLSILRRSVHFLPHARRDAALLAMQVLTRGLPVLARHEDELLPLVHATWAPLVPRFRSGEPALLRRALRLLLALAALSGDFIRARTLKEVLPEIYKFLHKSSKDSLLKDAGSHYRSGASYRLQVAALEALPSLARDLVLAGSALEDAMASVHPYLSKKQPVPLQQAAVTFFKEMLDYSYECAWFHLRAICNNDAVLEPPELDCIQLEPLVGTPYQARDLDYDANVKRIFDYMVS